MEQILRDTGLEQYTDKLKENDVDDLLFFKLLDGAAGSTEERLFAEIIPSVGHRLKIITAAREVSRSGSNFEQITLNFNCSICAFKFSSFKEYWQHIKEFHEIRKGKVRLNCPLCSMIFTELDNLQKHIHRNVCSVHRNVSGYFNNSDTLENNTKHNDKCSSEEFFPPNVIYEINLDYKLAFIKSLQMSGGISLLKSNEILSNANSLVNSIIEVAKDFSKTSSNSAQILVNLNTLRDPFPNSSSSQYELEKILKQKSLLVEPKEIKLGSHFKFDKNKGLMQEKGDNLYLFELSKTLPIILKKYSKIADSVNVGINPEILENFKSGDLFKTFKNNPLCLQIYYDDVEICNPLGTKAKIHKLALFYFVIANFPPQLNAKLENIFPLVVVKSKFVKEYGMNLILGPLVDELNSLHESSQKIAVLANSQFSHVQVLQFCGDNLGLHTMLGFVESFNANFRCRFCKMEKENTYISVVASIHKRRILSLYENDLGLENVSLTGIRESSIVNDIKGFHVTNNFAPDIMHDILEGICITELKLFLKHVINNGSLSIRQINHRLSSSFKKNSHAVSKLPEIDSSFVDGDKKSCFSASEMNHFFLIFPAVFGDKFSRNDKHWDLIIMLRRIIRILMAPRINRVGVSLLNNLIAEHHSAFLKLSQSKLTPKFHHLLHYAQAIRQLGPLKNYWCMRFEAKHRLAKTIGKNCYNFRNIAKTVSRRMALNLAFSIGCELVGEITYGSGSKIAFKDLRISFDFSKLSLNACDEIFCMDSVTICGTKIKPENYFILKNESTSVQFVQISLCFFHNERTHLVVRQVKYEEKFRNSYLFKIVSFENPVLIDPEKIYLESPLVVVNCLDDPQGHGLICCPIEFV
ncbi:uncharacterized protein LOC110849386 isoform X1 [Folsomia candida]|uniref:uncharacterized protein LOC110849386 isoform X1 n=1 Tax=Folsomia candida TaxID=158441 RepID=UPI0016055997|nr:uncharacterized protein LOC110849386 isoform X1 [Folsomia candida]